MFPDYDQCYHHHHLHHRVNLLPRHPAHMDVQAMCCVVIIIPMECFVPTPREVLVCTFHKPNILLPLIPIDTRRSAREEHKASTFDNDSFRNAGHPDRRLPFTFFYICRLNWQRCLLEFFLVSIASNANNHNNVMGDHMMMGCANI